MTLHGWVVDVRAMRLRQEGAGGGVVYRCEGAGGGIYLLWSMGVGVGKPLECSARMKANSWQHHDRPARQAGRQRDRTDTVIRPTADTRGVVVVVVRS